MEELLLNVREVSKIAGKKPNNSDNLNGVLTHNVEQVIKIMQRVRSYFAN